LKKLGFLDGDRIVTAVSYRYTVQGLQDVLEKHFGSHKLFYSQDGNTCVALCY